MLGIRMPLQTERSAEFIYTPYFNAFSAVLCLVTVLEGENMTFWRLTPADCSIQALSDLSSRCSTLPTGQDAAPGCRRARDRWL